jgi:hypothetical protein
MKLFTKVQYNSLINNGSDNNRGKDHKPVVKLFMPGTGCTWLLTELDPEEPDIAFGLCDLGMGFPELGYVSIPEITSVKHPVFGTGIERDLFFDGRYPISVYADAARTHQCIVEDDKSLQQHSQKKKPPGLSPQ